MTVCPATHLPSSWEQFRHQVRAFAEDEIRPRALKDENRYDVDFELAELLAQQPWATSLTFGSEYGGLGYGHRPKTIMLEELSRVSGDVGAIAQAPIIPTGAIELFGTEEQKSYWLAAIAAGEHRPAIDVTEPKAGGDILAMESTGVRADGDCYILNGHKAHVGNAHVATVHLVVVRTGPDRTRGLTAFLVEADRPGLEVLPHAPMMGLRRFSCAEVRLTNCRVPVANRLGEEGDGLRVAHAASILYGRPNLAAVALGLQQATWEAVDQHIATNPRLTAQQVVTQRHGNIRRRLHTSRTVLYEAVGLLDRGIACDEELIAAKFEIVAAAEESTRDAIKAVGADGLYIGNRFEEFFRNAFCLWFPAGTGDAQLHRLSKLPHENRRQLSEMFASTITSAIDPRVSAVPDTNMAITPADHVTSSPG